jgi:hypothetical protein
MTTREPKMPTIKTLSALIRSYKPEICDDYVDEPGDTPYITLTIGCDTTTGEWSYQSGDNSYSGGAYGYPDWAVITVSRRSDSRALARDIQDQLADLFYSRG